MPLNKTVRRLRLFASALLIVLWGASALNYATLTPVARNGHVKGGDYAHFYVMARFAAQRRGPQLYDMDAQKREFSHAMPGVDVPNYLPFLYPPQAALFLVPFGLTTYFPSLILWWLAGFSVYGVSCWLALRACPRLQKHVTEVILIALAFPGFWELFIYGHTTWIALGLLSLFYVATKGGRDTVAGVSIGLLAYKPQLGIAVLMLLLAQRRWRAMFSAAATIVVLNVAVWAWFGPDVFAAYAAFMRVLPSIAPLVEPQQFQLCSLRGFFTLLGTPVTFATVAAVLVSAVVCWWMVKCWRGRSIEIGFAALLLATILISPHETVYDLVLLAPAIILLAEASLFDDYRPLFIGLLVGTYFVAMSGPVAEVLHVQLASPLMVALSYSASKLTSRLRESAATV